MRGLRTHPTQRWFLFQRMSCLFQSHHERDAQGCGGLIRGEGSRVIIQIERLPRCWKAVEWNRDWRGSDGCNRPYRKGGEK